MNEAPKPKRKPAIPGGGKRKNRDTRKAARKARADERAAKAAERSSELPEAS